VANCPYADIDASPIVSLWDTLLFFEEVSVDSIQRIGCDLADPKTVIDHQFGKLPTANQHNTFLYAGDVVVSTLRAVDSQTELGSESPLWSRLFSEESRVMQ
tara:strand:- start:914 stop:1219 length:306 start_codon:yes stop_codon:yes gene_type:complete